MEEKLDFTEVCEKNGIRLFEGLASDHFRADIELLPEQFIDYCLFNGIKSVILTYCFAEVEEIDTEQIELKLRRFFDRKMQKYPYADTWRPPHIPQDYYLPALTEALEKLRREDFKVECSEEDDDIIQIDAWIIQSGCRLSTLVYQKEEDQAVSSVSEQDVLNKYAALINEKLDLLQIEAEKESQRITKEIEAKTLAEVEEIIRGNDKLISYNTQRARYDFADRIQSTFQEEKGCIWLTKKQVRAMVDHFYYKLTE